MKTRCCFIIVANEATGGLVPDRQCEKPAEWEAHAHDGHPHNYTQGCADHIGHLLNDGTAWTLSQLEA